MNGFQIKFAGIHPINGGSIYRVTAGETPIADLIAVENKDTACAGMNLHPLYIAEAGASDGMLQVKQFVHMKDDHKGKRFGTQEIRVMFARYGAHYLAQLFITKNSFDQTCPDNISALEDDDQDAIDEDGSYGLGF